MATLNFPDTPSGFESTLITFRSTYYLSASSISKLKSVTPSVLHGYMMSYIKDVLPSAKKVDFTDGALIATEGLFGTQDLKTLSSMQYLLVVYLLYINKENLKEPETESNDILNFASDLKDGVLSIDVNKTYKYLTPEVLKEKLDFLSTESNEKGTFLVDLGIDVPVKILWA